MCDHFEECRKRFDKVDAALKELNDRLFVGDGTPALATRVDRVERAFKAILIVAISVGGKIAYDMLKS